MLALPQRRAGTWDNQHLAAGIRPVWGEREKKKRNYFHPCLKRLTKVQLISLSLETHLMKWKHFSDISALAKEMIKDWCSFHALQSLCSTPIRLTSCFCHLDPATVCLTLSTSASTHFLCGGVLDFLTACQATDWKPKMIEGKENWQFPRLNCETSGYFFLAD